MQLEITNLPSILAHMTIQSMMINCIKEAQKQDSQYVILKQKAETELDLKFMINEIRVLKRKEQLWVPLSVHNKLLH